MNLSTIVETLLGRRQSRLEDLQAQLEQLQTDHEAALIRGDDSAAEKLFAKVEKCLADIRAAESAIASTERQDAAKRRAAATAEQQRLNRERDDAAKLPMRLAEELERDAIAFAAKWVALFEAHEKHHQKARAARTPDQAPEMHPGGLTPAKVLSVVFFQLVSGMQRPGYGPVAIPTAGSRSRTTESIASRHARFLADPQRQVSQPAQTAQQEAP